MLDFILVLTGTVIGGGFASGREIGTYFIEYGKYACFSMAVFSALFFAICFKICCICREEKVFTEEEFFKKVYGKTGGEVIFAFTAVYSFVVLSSMLSAMASLCGEFFEKDIFFRTVFSAGVYIILKNGIKGLKAVNYILVPILAAGLIFGGEYFGESLAAEQNYHIAKSLFSAVIYTCYNIITVIPAVVIFSKDREKFSAFICCIVSAGILFVCAVSAGKIIRGNYFENMLYDIPVIKAVENGNFLMKAVVIFSVFSAMATTAASAGCWVYEYGKRRYNLKNPLFIAFLAFMACFMKFSIFVDKLYFIFGAAAIYEVIVLLKYKKS